MAWDIHGVMQDADNEDASILNHVKDDVVGMPMAEQVWKDVVGRPAQARIFRQGMQAIAEAQKIALASPKVRYE